MRTRLVSIVLVVLCVQGCARVSAPQPATLRFGALLARDLVAFEQQIDWGDYLDRRDDQWFLAAAWADLVNCRTLSTLQPSAVDARFVMATLRLEQARHQRLLVERRSDALDRIWLRVLHDGAFFNRVPSGDEPGTIHWIREREVWLDEAPAPVEVRSRCHLTSRRNPEVLEERLLIERDFADALARRAHSLPQTNALVPTLSWRARWHAIVLTYRLAALSEEQIRQLEDALRTAESLPEERRPSAERTAAALDALRSSREAYESRSRDLRARAERLLSESIPLRITHFERAQLRTLTAFVQASEGALREALEAIRPVAELELEAHAALASRYLLVTLARRAHEYELARRFISPLPDESHPLYEAMVYEAIRTLAELDEVPALLAIATGALRDRSSGGPFRSAALQVTLSALTDLEFDERTIEIIEDLGPRNRLTARMALFAQLALENDRPTLTEHATDWLLEREPNALVRRRYLTWKATAAFVADDLDAFAELAEAILARPRGVRRAIGRARQARFFRQQDRAFIALLSELLPRMAEWLGDARYRERHQRWLGYVVERVQEFVRTTPETMEREALSSLYRIASAQLDELPRGYAEHVGPAQERAGEELPVLLGRVRALPPEPRLLRFTPISRPRGGFGVVPGEEWSLAGLYWEGMESETTESEGSTP